MSSEDDSDRECAVPSGLELRAEPGRPEAVRGSSLVVFAVLGLLLFWWATSGIILVAANKLGGTWGLILLGVPGTYIWFGIIIAAFVRLKLRSTAYVWNESSFAVCVPSARELPLAVVDRSAGRNYVAISVHPASGSEPLVQAR